MRLRALTAAGLAISAFIANTAIAGAARSPELTKIAIGTFLVALGLMIFLSIVYAIKVATGIERPLPPEDPNITQGHH